MSKYLLRRLLISVPTLLGPAVLEATEFVTAPQAGQPMPAASNAKTF